MQRMGQCIRLDGDAVAEYKRVHAQVWPQVLEVIGRAQIRNYSIFLREPENVLFAYWEYHGDDFARDAAEMARAEVMQRWWKLCDPMQRPLDSRAEGEWWAPMEEVFHLP
jgi:L-rhamnose mutarotase